VVVGRISGMIACPGDRYAFGTAETTGHACAHGLTNAGIATRLFLRETTVRSHVTSILAKFGARDRVQVVVRCYEAGLIRPGRST